jgi:hypothetical protein
MADCTAVTEGCTSLPALLTMLMGWKGANTSVENPIVMLLSCV